MVANTAVRKRKRKPYQLTEQGALGKRKLQDCPLDWD